MISFKRLGGGGGGGGTVAHRMGDEFFSKILSPSWSPCATKDKPNSCSETNSKYEFEM